jgi:hypothetical protein
MRAQGTPSTSTIPPIQSWLPNDFPTVATTSRMSDLDGGYRKAPAIGKTNVMKTRLFKTAKRQTAAGGNTRRAPGKLTGSSEY